MRDARFLFLMRGGFDPTVIDSQVVDPIVAAGELGVRFELVAFVAGNLMVSARRELAERSREISARTGGVVRLHFAPRQTRPSGDAYATALLLAEIALPPARRTVIHARGDGSALYASRAQRLWPGVRFVYDVRGDSAAEFALTPGLDRMSEPQRARQLRRIEFEQRTGARDASHLFCVSEVLRERFIQRFGVASHRVSVVPCVADTRKFHLDEEERAVTRAELSLEHRFVVVYPGRFGRWHYGPEMIATVQGLMEADADVFFLVLTPDVDEARALAAGLPPGRYEIRSARHTEVPRYLRAADLGLLLREKHPLNEVACPTKFAEYMTCGVPVLISSGIGDCSAFVAEHAAGCVLDAPDPAAAAAALARLREESAEHRRRRIAQAAARFSRERVTRQMVEIYRRLAEL